MAEQVSINSQAIKKLVDNVLSNNLKLPSLEGREFKTVEKKENLEDPTREFKDLATEIVTNEFLKHSDQITLFIYTISSVFKQALEYYRILKMLKTNDIIFVYKGGNILRILAFEFLHELPGSVFKIIDKYYKEAFKKSDADFSIYIDPNVPNYEQVFSDITALSYYLLVYLRHLFLKHETSFFDFKRYNPEYTSQRFEYYRERLNKGETLKNAESEYHNIKFVKFQLAQEANEFKNDTLVIPNPNDKQTNATFDFTDNIIKPSDYYISVNETLDFKTGSVYNRFNLVRMKVNFISEFQKVEGTQQKMKIGGELIDVSIMYKESSGIKEFFKDVDHNIRTFKVETPISFNFQSYSLNYFIHDLENILFDQGDQPWLDRKYKKRINRLLFLYFVDFVGSKANLLNKEEYIFDALSNVVTPNGDPAKLDRKIIDSRVYNLKFTRYFEEYKRLANAYPNDENFKDYIDVSQKNFQVMFNALRELRQYVKEEGVIQESSLYDIDLQMGGRKHMN